MFRLGPPDINWGGLFRMGGTGAPAGATCGGGGGTDKKTGGAILGGGTLSSAAPGFEVVNDSPDWAKYLLLFL